MSLLKLNPLKKWLNKNGKEVPVTKSVLARPGFLSLDGWFDGWFKDSYSPSIDVIDRKNKYLVKAEIPGVDPKELKLFYDDGVLTIRGEKKHEEENSGKDYYHYECSYGSFTRSIPFEEEVDDKKIEATCKNGVLKVTLPKKEGAKSKALRIKVH